MRSHVLILLLLASLFTLPLCGQQSAWKLPVRGAVEFTRDGSARTGTAADEAAAMALLPTTAAPEKLLPRLPPAPWLCQGELRPDQQAIAEPPRDLRDVIRAVATDFDARSGSRWTFPRLLPFGDLRLSGQVAAVTSAGEQRFELKVDGQPPVPQPGEGKDVAERLVRPACPYAESVRGSLLLVRQVDQAAGLVRRFQGTLRLVWRESRTQWRTLVIDEAWTLVAVRDPQDADFRKRVSDAVAAAAAWLRSELDGVDETFLHDKKGEPRSFGSGRLALGLLTLLHAHTPPDDRVVAAGFDALRKRKLIDSYSLAVALMAMAQRHGPPGEVTKIRTGELKERVQRQLPEADRVLAQRWVDTLLGNIDPRVPAAQQLRFNYIGGKRWDVSLQQYGLLGLDAAALCGLTIPSTAWAAAAAPLLQAQGPHHGRHSRLQLLSHREVAEAAGGPLPEPAPTRVPTRGFAYQEPTSPAYGSMTSAGINGLVLARQWLVRAGGSRELVRQIDDAIDAGFGWLAEEFSVRSNPGFAGRSDDHWYYWLYGLERTCELSGVALLQGRDWYYEGGLQLLAQQQPNGSFKAEHTGSLLLDATCFAVLFLQKSTPPAMTRTGPR
ncbi:MAG: hypothetical protein IPK26_15950 [Planctomycetes bacterium]|nr:hypothetical protein [Planctomycetota bacterium]